jgi:DNA-binding MarR family transcriptional regulator
MQEKGLLKVQQSKQDARVTEVSITANGLALLEKVLLETADIFDRALNGIGEQEILEINALLERLFNNLSDTY